MTIYVHIYIRVYRYISKLLPASMGADTVPSIQSIPSVVAEFDGIDGIIGNLLFFLTGGRCPFGIVVVLHDDKIHTISYEVVLILHSMTFMLIFILILIFYVYIISYHI